MTTIPILKYPCSPLILEHSLLSNSLSMIAKDNILSSISSNRHRTFSHVVRYRTYLTPPSNPFREGKSKFQVLRELLLVVLVCAVVLMTMSRLLYHRPIDESNNVTRALQPPAEALALRTTAGLVNTEFEQQKGSKNRFQKLRSEPMTRLDEANRNELHVDSATSPSDKPMTKSIDTTHRIEPRLVADNALIQSFYPDKTPAGQEASAIPIKEGFQLPLETSSERIVNQMPPSEQKDIPREREQLQQAGTHSVPVQIKAS